MTSTNALRYLATEAARCHDLSMGGNSEARDAHTMLCLLFPAIMETLELQPMDEFELRAFQFDFRESLKRRRELVTMRRELHALELAR